MIQPDEITNYDRSYSELVELFIFCVFVAGHNAHSTAYGLEHFLNKHVRTSKSKSLRNQLRSYVKSNSVMVAAHLKESGIGCYTRNAQFIMQLADSEVNLRTASITELEQFIGVGPKTSRFFVLHSRAGVNDIAVLDTHILNFLEEQGVDVPKSTPSGKRYKTLEKEFLKLAEEAGKTVADFDLEVWKARRVKRG